MSGARRKRPGGDDMARLLRLVTLVSGLWLAILLLLAGLSLLS